jgi:hypothetical protein
MNRARDPKYNIIDGVIILVVVIFLCLKFAKSSFFPVVLLVSAPFALYALKIIFLDGIASRKGNPSS